MCVPEAVVLWEWDAASKHLEEVLLKGVKRHFECLLCTLRVLTVHTEYSAESADLRY